MDQRRDSAVCSNSKADVNAAQPDGMTALHWAAYQDDLGSGGPAAARRRQCARGEPLRRHAAFAGLHQRQCRHGRATARRGRRSPTLRCPEAKRCLMTCGAHRQGRARSSALLVHGADVNAKRKPRRTDRADVGRGRRARRRWSRRSIEAGADFRTPLDSGIHAAAVRRARRTHRRRDERC